ncbi:hypothetical protein BJF92_11175 [Rhizobium rhizosphaerae]|uniref:Uncharacterized protein n=1 Tax=Xaviernesmea rhizosphaerae TaxID=1672749 RepID=A0A1Q9AMS5_9HYPH|nr:hypothetical protein [Xaviernesmea rhizosphaerae]OLP56645.1 hypothetical protein BJF92_11175 [Xaviernesmea rhizosphaerae]
MSKTKAAVVETITKLHPVAEAICDKMRHYGEGCHESQLRAHFTKEQLDAHGDAARDLANSQWQREIAPRSAAR